MLFVTTASVAQNEANIVDSLKTRYPDFKSFKAKILELVNLGAPLFMNPKVEINFSKNFIKGHPLRVKFDEEHDGGIISTAK